MTQILPRDLTAVPSGIVNPSAAVIVDNLDGVFKATPANLVDSGAPVNTQVEAEAGLVNTGRMTPLRVAQAIDALGVSADVLAAPSGLSGVGFIQSGTGSVARTAEAKAREIISFADKGVPTDGSSGTTAINNAIATGRHVEAGTGTYYAQGIIISSDGQTLAARGNASIVRNANGALINSAANDITIEGVAFYGDDPTYTGDLLTFTGDRGKLILCSARDAGSDQVLTITGDSWTILGCNDVYDGKVSITSDGGGQASLYHSITGARFNGLVELIDTGFVSVDSALFADGLTVDEGSASTGNHGPRLTNSRIVGALTVTQSSTSIGSGMSVSGNVVIGDGTTPFTGICVDPSFVQSGGTFTILAGVKGTFHLGGLYEAGVTVNIPDSVRAASLVYHGKIDFTPTISGDGGSFVAGNSVLTAKYSQQGNHVFVNVRLEIGDTGVTLPTGGLYHTVPVATSERLIGRVTVFDSGNPRTGIVRIFSDNRVAGWFPQDSANDSQLTVTSPFTLGSGDVVEWDYMYSLAGL